jgi:hypothetical protein
MLTPLEKAFWVIGDKIVAMSSGQNHNFEDKEIREENITSELVIRPYKKSTQTPIETRESLNRLTKKQICDLCSERFGIDLNLRTEKKVLISQFLEEQNTEVT